MEHEQLRRKKLALSAVCMLFAGVIYAWSVLKAPLQQEFGWTSSALSLNFTLTLCFFCMGGVLGSRITKRWSPKTGLLIAALLVALGFCFSSGLTGNILMLYLFYAGLAGTGIGVTYNIIISTANAWFPDKKGLCSGVLMMCFGLSSLMIGKGADLLFQMPSMGWRKTFLLLGLSISGVIALCGLGISTPPAGMEFPPPKKAVPGAFPAQEMTTPEMIRRASFWKFFCFSILTSASGNAIINFARDLALAAGAQAALAATLVGVLSLCNGFGRIISGLLSDAFGVRRTMLISNSIALLAPLVVLLGVNHSSLPLCTAGLCLTGVAYGFLATIISAFTASFYGLKCFSSNYSFSNLMIFPASFGATLASVLLEHSGGYTAPLTLLIVFSALALCINLTIKKA